MTAQKKEPAPFWWSGREDWMLKRYQPVRNLSLGKAILDLQPCLDLLCGATSEDEIVKAMQMFCDANGIPRCGFLQIHDHSWGRTGTPRAMFSIEDFLSAYLQEGILDIDVVTYMARFQALPVPFGLPEQRATFSGKEFDLYSFVGDYDCRCGLVVPLHGVNSYSVVGILLSEKEKSFVGRMSDMAAQANLFSSVLYDAIRRVRLSPGTKIANVTIPALTPRESECLHWVAAGKTAWEISCILGIAERTVIAHVESAKKRLGAKTLPQAVARALSLGMMSI